jgi:hypothetical protein
MSIIDPNKRQQLLIDDFIRYAKQHLNTVQGTAFCSTNYITSLGVPAPGVCNWKGYFVPDVQKIEVEIPNLPVQSTKFASADGDITVGLILDYDADAELVGDGTVYSTLKKASGNIVNNSGKTAQTNYVSTNGEARKSAESYLGRPMTDDEWNNLVSITYAEATTNQTERAWVMATVLNRTRIGYTPLGPKNPKYKFETVTDIINQPFQYQPVTGTRFKPGPVSNFINGPNALNAKSIYGAATNILKDVPKEYKDFTSNDVRDYGPGTDPTYILKLRAKPSAKVIGGTIFAY